MISLKKINYSNFWMGFVFAISIAVVIAFAKKDSFLSNWDKSRKAQEERETNPSPATMDDFCRGANPKLNPDVLFHNPKKHIGQRVCLTAVIEIYEGEMAHDLFSFKTRSGAWNEILTISAPSYFHKFFIIGDTVDCGGYEAEPLREEYFDYLPRVDCMFMNLNGAAALEMTSEMTTEFIKRGWRRAIIGKYGDKTREIWLDKKNGYPLEFKGSAAYIEEVSMMFEYPSEGEENLPFAESPNEKIRIFLEVFMPMSARDNLSDWLSGAMTRLEQAEEGEENYSVSGFDIEIIRVKNNRVWQVIVSNNQ